MAIDDAYQRLYANQGTPGYYGGSPGGVATQPYASPASAWGGSPIDLTGGSSYQSFSQGYPDSSQGYPNIFPGISQGYPGGQDYSQGYPGGYTQGYPGGQDYSQGPGDYSQDYPGGQDYSQGYPVNPQGGPDDLNSPDEETDTDTDTETPMPSPPSNDDEHGLKNDPTVLTTPEAYQSLTQISHAGQWEAITGGDAKTPLTLDAAQKALSNPDSKLSDDTKKTLQWTVDNWAAVAGDNSKSLSLEQAQKLGTTPTTDASSPDKAPLEKGIYLPKDQFMSGFSQDLPPDQNSDVKGFDATQQQNVGDCRYLSIARGISETDKGKKYLRDAIHKNENGSYDIKFAGADKAIHVGTEDLDEQGEVYAKGDPDMIAIAAATSKYYQSDTPNKVSEEQLYTGVNPTVIKARTDSDSNFYADLKGVAPHLGKDVSIAMGGAPGKDGEFDTDASNHCFQISKIDFNETSPGESIVHYTNPWDSSQDRTLSASDLYQKLHNGDQNTGIWATQVS